MVMGGECHKECVFILRSRNLVGISSPEKPKCHRKLFPVDWNAFSAGFSNVSEEVEPALIAFYLS